MGGRTKLAILEKEVMVKLLGGNKIYYLSKGYQIPTYIDSKGKVSVKRDTQILVKVEHLPSKSAIKLTKICDVCNKEVGKLSYCDITKSRLKCDGLDKCVNCIRIHYNENKNIPYKKSLEYFSINNNRLYLINEFSNKNTKRIKEVSYGSSKIFKWECFRCGNNYTMRVKDRTMQKRNCPYCRKRRVNETNCIWSTHPEIASLLKDKKEGYKIHIGSEVKITLVCPDCNFESTRRAKTLKYKSFNCTNCSDRVSYPEKFMSNVLDQLSINYIKHKKFDWSNDKIYDFYIPSFNVIIETHGGQHSGKGFGNLGGRTLEEEKENDLYKEKLAKYNGIENYFSVDCKYSNRNYISESLINGSIADKFDFSNVNWNKSDEYASSSFLKKACDLWEEGYKTHEIAYKQKLTRSTVIRYLKRGKEIGLCSYDPKEEQRKSALKSSRIHADISKKRVLQFTLQNNFIREWDSLTSIQNELGFHKGNVSRVCRSAQKYKTAYGYKWLFKEDYERQKEVHNSREELQLT